MSATQTHLSRRTLLAALPAALTARAADAGQLVYFGTYSRGASKGIYVARFDAATGKLSLPQLAAEAPNPSFLTLHPDGKFLYSVGEAGKGIVTAYSRDAATGLLKPINTVESQGSSPCHLVVDATKRNLLVVNYGDGVSIIFPIKADGGLGEASSVVKHAGTGPNARRQTGPHAHSVNLSKNNRWAVVADLGTDEYIVYALDAKNGKITRHSAAKVKGGSGPRHFSFHPSYQYAFGVNEMGSSVTAFRWSEDQGKLEEVTTVSTLPKDFAGENNCAEVLVHPNGRFVYASNRGHNSLAIFDVDMPKGSLKVVDYASTLGKTPRNFRIHSSGKWLLAANQDSSNVVVFKLDPATGKITPTGQTVDIGFPVCIRFA
jgi:6-phosphogluconolactonase